MSDHPSYDVIWSKGRRVDTETRRIWIRGNAFIENGRYADLAAEFSDSRLENGLLKEQTRRLNGFFAAVIEKEGSIHAVVDRVRSYPVFYAVHQDKLLISDDAYEIQKLLGDRKSDPVVMAEFLMTGYVTGDSTFDPRISQIPAGEILHAYATGRKWTIERAPYYRFHHYDPLPDSLEALQQAHLKEMEEAVRRLTEYSAGAMIAVPLSGGYDSRFVLMMLKRLSYPRIVAFSYGRPGNADAEISREIANRLRIPWRFIPYSAERWRTWFSSPEWRDYMRQAESLVSVAHIQDWPAVWELKNSGDLDRETVFAPGHSGDFLAGKQIPKILLHKRTLDTAWVVKAVWERNYLNTDSKRALEAVGLGVNSLKALQDRTADHFGSFDVHSQEGAIDAYDFEFWQEKLSKFVVNSTRVYEYWGYRWWLPFYDRQLVRFWEKVPLRYRVNKLLYNRTVEALQRAFGIDIGYPGKDISVFGKWIRKQRWALILRAMLGSRARLVKGDILDALAAFPEADRRRHLGRIGNINTMLGYWHIDRYTGQSRSEGPVG